LPLTIVILSKEGIQYISPFFPYQKEQLKQGLQTLSKKYEKNLKNFPKKEGLFEINVV
jgi:hypothetical protein